MLEYLKERAGLEMRFIMEYWYIYVAMIVILIVAIYIAHNNK